MTHTPGPWYVTGSSPDGTVFGGPNHRLIIPHVNNAPNKYRDWNGAEDMANRRLIAAAPEMLAALKARLNAWHADDANFERDEPPDLALARAAVAKAKGQEG